MDAAPFIQALEQGLWAVKTSPDAVWYMGENYHAAQSMCRSIEAFQQAYRAVQEILWKERSALNI